MCLGEFTLIGQDDFLKGYNFLIYRIFIKKEVYVMHSYFSEKVHLINCLKSGDVLQKVGLEEEHPDVLMFIHHYI